MSQNFPVINAGSLYINNMVVSWASNTTLSVTAGQCRDSNNIVDISVSSTTTINAATTGLNGLDTGSLANSTWYYVFAIADSTQTNLSGYLLSTSSTAPQLPGGYDSFRLISAFETDGSANFLLGYWAGTSSEREFFWDTPVSVLSNGNATTLTSVDLSSAVPTVLNKVPVKLDVQHSPNGAGGYVLLVPGGSSATTGAKLSGDVASVSTFGQLQTIAVQVSSVPAISYINSAASGATTLLVNSFKFYV